MVSSTENGLINIYTRICEVLAVIYMAAYTGVQGRIAVVSYYGGHPTAEGMVLVRSVAVAFFLMMFFYCATKWRRDGGFWSLTLTLAFAIQVFSSALQLILYTQGTHLPHNWVQMADMFSGPVASIYLWSLFLYSLFVIRRDISGTNAAVSESDDGLESQNIIKLRVSPFTTLLTVLLIVIVPVLVYLSVNGLIVWPVSDHLRTFAETWGVALSFLIFVGYLLLHRNLARSVTRYITLVFALGTLHSASNLVVSSPQLGQIVPSWQIRIVLVTLVNMIPIVQVYFWLQAGLTADSDSRQSAETAE